jgi:6-phosphogluconolactonase
MVHAGVSVFDSPAALASAAADEFVDAWKSAIATSARFAVALSGGKTPRAMFEALAGRPVDWAVVHFFWSDERCVPPDDVNSNFRMAREALLSKIAAPRANIHRMKGELEPRDGASDYNGDLQRFFAAQPPRFDLIFLGLGPDGHTASLFPQTRALDVADVSCVANRVSSGVASPWRLTLTYPVLNAARRIAFLVEGADKASIVKEVLEGPRDAQRLPAQGVAPGSGRLRWMLDQQAAAMLSDERRD